LEKFAAMKKRTTKTAAPGGEHGPPPTGAAGASIESGEPEPTPPTPAPLPAAPPAPPQSPPARDGAQKSPVFKLGDGYVVGGRSIRPIDAVPRLRKRDDPAESVRRADFDVLGHRPDDERDLVYPNIKTVVPY
jgi:hypothetical protein